MTAIQSPNMDEFWANRIEGTGPDPWGHAPVSDRVARRQRIAESNPRYTPYVEALIEAQGAEPIRHRRASRWERITRSPWFLPVVVVTFPTLIIVLGILAVRWIEYMQRSAL